jgi:AsmA protein
MGGGPGGMKIEDVLIREVAIRDGAIRYVDRKAGSEKRLEKIDLSLKDVTLETPVRFAFSATLDDKPFALEGSIGPIGKTPGKGDMTLDLAATLFGELGLKLDGKVRDAAGEAAFDLNLVVDAFSPRKLMAALDLPFPVATTDPQALDRVAFSARLKGNKAAVSLGDGRMELDDSTLTFTAAARDFSKPDVSFAGKLDQIDLDRYLPPKTEKGNTADRETAVPEKKAPGKKEAIDYKPLRNLKMDARLEAGRVVARKMVVEDIEVSITAAGGKLRTVVQSNRLYEGRMAADTRVDVTGKAPYTRVAVDMTGVQAGPLFRDVSGKERIEGDLEAKLDLTCRGDQADAIKRSLSGGGDVTFRDGALIGIDLEAMVQNTAAAFGLAQKTQQQPKTVFSLFAIPFTLTRGVFDTRDTRLESERFRLKAHGQADLPAETLNFRVEPVYVEKKKDNTKEIVVPVFWWGAPFPTRSMPRRQGSPDPGVHAVPQNEEKT